MQFSAVELVGYVASALVVASLAMTSVVRLRLVSLVGSIVFVVYGALLPSIPIIVTNAAVAALNIWFLRKEFSPHRDLGAVPIAWDAPFLLDFLRSHKADIRSFQPGFQPPDAGDFVRLLTRDGLPAGVLIGAPEGDVLRLRLDYVMHAYRDSRIGTWLYRNHTMVFTDAGFRTLTTVPASDAQRHYLIGVGFVPRGPELALDLRAR